MRTLCISLLLASCAASWAQSSNAAIAGPPCVISQTSELALTGWSTCAQTGCNPGGTGVPTATSIDANQTFGGFQAMAFAVTAEASKQTNVLWPHSTTAGTGCVHDDVVNYVTDVWVYVPAVWAGNAGSGGSKVAAFEMDQYHFCSTCTAGGSSTGIRYMFGGQLCESGCPSGKPGWDIGGNSNVPWTYSGVSAAQMNITFDAWHHFMNFTHRIASEVTSKPCLYTSGGTVFHVPYIYFDGIKWDGVYYPINMKFCSNINPSGWTGRGNQFQLDMPSKATAYSAGEYIHANTFQASK